MDRYDPYTDKFVRDTIDRQAAIDALHMDTSIIPFKKAREYADATISEIRNRLEKLPSAESESFEWCDTCKEYDQEQHCCHRFTKVIRQAFEEMKVVHCNECQHSEYDEVYKDRYCHYNGKAEVVDDYHFCRDGERREDG